MEIKLDDLSDPKISCFLEEHINEMKSVSPPESKHALDIEGLKASSVTFWSVWDDTEIVGCGALKEWDVLHAEVKSMRVASAARGQGIASQLLAYIINQARLRGYQRVSLETGAMPFFEPARKLYEKFGFEYCTPFGDYINDPNSVFMSCKLDK